MTPKAMRRQRRALEKALDALLQRKEGRPGPRLRIQNPQYRQALINAILQHGSNGSQVYKTLCAQGLNMMTYKQVQVYMRRLFGSYEEVGRPAKYCAGIGRRRPVNLSDIQNEHTI